MDVAVTYNGKRIGWIQGATFRKDIVESLHILRKPSAIAYNLSVLRGLEAQGVTHMLVVTDQGRFFETTLDAVFKYGMAINRGHGDQLAVPLKHWSIRKETREDPDTQGLPQSEVQRPDDTPRQASFLRPHNTLKR